MTELIVLASAIIGAAVGGQQFWTRIVAPRTRAHKLKGAFALIQQWFDQIDTSLEHGVDLPRLHNLEARIDRYIVDQGLARHQLKFSPAVRRRFLQACGLREEFYSAELFEKYSRYPASGVDLQTFWQLLAGAFSGFHGAYVSGRPGANFADVEMRVKVLRLYLNVRQD